MFRVLQVNIPSTSAVSIQLLLQLDPWLTRFGRNLAFFTNRETKEIGGGLVLWRGYFQYALSFILCSFPLNIA